MKIWVVEKGSYSDYRVVGVYTSEENAKKVCDFLNASDPYDEATFAEWPLDPAVTELNQGLKQYLVHIKKDGEVSHCEPWDAVSSYLSGSVSRWKEVMIAIVWATDEKHAVKIANEKRAEWIALGKW